MKKIVVTGGSGFIGSYIAERLIQNGFQIKIIDKKPLQNSLLTKYSKSSLLFSNIDLSNYDLLEPELLNYDAVFHFAASADIALGKNNTALDLQQGTVLTYNVLEAMRQNNINKIIFPSSSTVYGYPKVVPTSETEGPLLPASLYGASKLASEGLISAFCYLYGFKSWIFRFGNVIGKQAPRGVIVELIKKLQTDSKILDVLGDGTQLKDYIYIDDCVNAILHTYEHSNEKINLFNLSTGEAVSVNQIVDLIIKLMNLNPKINYSGGENGWKGGGWAGDINVVHYDISKIQSTGWMPKFSGLDAVKKTILEILEEKTH